MEELNKNQMIMLVLLTSFVTSVATGIVTVSLMEQSPEPFTQTVYKVIEKMKETDPKGAADLAASLKPQETQEDKLVKVVNSASAAVVSVIASKDLPVMEEYFIDPFGQEGAVGGLFPSIRIPQYRQKGVEKKQVSSGTGFFISKDGLILTNKHVVEDAAAEYSIVMNSGKKYGAKVLARDPFQDIAILKIATSSPVAEKNAGTASSTNATSTDAIQERVPASFSFLPLGNSDNVKVGQNVIAIGNALGEFSNTVSVGIISGLRRDITASGAASGPEQLKELIQTDAAINPGNSGGPLLNFDGKVIGINAAVSTSGENVGFALPINIAKRDVNDATKFGKIKYPYLGVRYQPMDDGLLISKGPAGEEAVDANGPAGKIGLKEGDKIIEMAGEKVNASSPLDFILSKRNVGDEIEVKYLRDGKETVVKVILGERPEK